MPNPVTGLENIIPQIMPQTREELRDLLERDNTMNPRVQAAMLKDPAMVIAVFREFAHQKPNANIDLTDCAHAISMLGIQALEKLLDTLPDLTLDPHNRHDIRIAYSQAAHAAAIAHGLAQHAGQTDNEQLATAALLQHPAIISLWHHDPEAAGRATTGLHDGVPIEVTFSAELGRKLDIVDNQLAEAWGFPHIAIQTIGTWNPWDKQQQRIALANHLAREVLADWHSEETELYIELLAEHLNTTWDKANAWLKQLLANTARNLQTHAYPSAAYAIPMLPGDEDWGIEVPVFSKNKTAQKQAPKTNDELLQTLMSQIMRKLKKEVGIKRVALMMYSHDYSHLATRMVIGGHKTDSLRKLKTELSARHLFALLRAKPQSIHVTSESFEKYKKHLPRELLLTLGTKHFAAMSIFSEGKPIGVLYGDGSDLDDSKYQKLRKLCLYANKQLNPRKAA